MQPTVLIPRPLLPSQVAVLTFDDLEYFLTRSRTFAWALIVGLPALGIPASLFFELPLFASLMAGSFLLATALVCRKAVARFTSQTLRLLVAARLVIILVVGALLFCVTGTAWMGIVSALLLWLVADRLLGRYALGLLARSSRNEPHVQTMLDDDAQGESLNGFASRLFPSTDAPDEDNRPRRRGRRKV